jgi:hypothetical protein
MRILVPLAIVTALVFWGTQLILWWDWIIYSYRASGLSRQRLPIQLLLFSLISYALLMALWLTTKSDYYVYDPLVPHTIVTAGTILLLMIINAVVIIAALIANAIVAAKTT